MWCHYNTVSFLPNTHKICPIACPWGQDMGCILWVQILIYVLLLSLQLAVCNIRIWVRSRSWGCLVTWFCYHFISKPGNKTASVSLPDPYIGLRYNGARLDCGKNDHIIIGLHCIWWLNEFESFVHCPFMMVISFSAIHTHPGNSIYSWPYPWLFSTMTLHIKYIFPSGPACHSPPITVMSKWAR